MADRTLSWDEAFNYDPSSPAGTPSSARPTTATRPATTPARSLSYQDALNFDPDEARAPAASPTESDTRSGQPARRGFGEAMGRTERGVAPTAERWEQVTRENRERREKPTDDSWAELGRKFLNTLGGLAQSIGGGLAEYAASGPLPMPNAPLTAEERADREGMQQAIDRAAANDELLGSDLRREGQATMEANRPNVDPWSTKGLVFDAGVGVAQTGAALATGVATRSPMAATAVFSGTVLGQAFADSRQKGRTPEQASLDAAFAFVSEAAPEYLPLKLILKPGGSALAKIGKGAAAEAVQEAVTEALQMGYDAGMYGEDVTFAEAAERLARAGIIGGGMGAVFGGVGAAADRVRAPTVQPEAGAPRVEPTPDDIASPIDTADIVDGQQIIENALASLNMPNAADDESMKPAPIADSTNLEPLYDDEVEDLQVGWFDRSTGKTYPLEAAGTTPEAGPAVFPPVAAGPSDTATTTATGTRSDPIVVQNAADLEAASPTVNVEPTEAANDLSARLDRIDEEIAAVRDNGDSPLLRALRVAGGSSGVTSTMKTAVGASEPRYALDAIRAAKELGRDDIVDTIVMRAEREAARAAEGKPALDPSHPKYQNAVDRLAELAAETAAARDMIVAAAGTTAADPSTVTTDRTDTTGPIAPGATPAKATTLYHGTRGPKLAENPNGLGFTFYALNEDTARRYADGQGGRRPRDGDPRIETRELPAGAKILDVNSREGLEVLASLPAAGRHAGAVISSATRDLTERQLGDKPMWGTNTSTTIWQSTKLIAGTDAAGFKRHITDELRKRGYAGIRFLDDGHPTVALFDDVASAAPSKPAKFDPQAYVGQARDYVANRRNSLDYKSIAKKLGVTNGQAQRIMGALAAQPNSGLFISRKGNLRRKVQRQGPVDVVTFLRDLGGIRNDEGHNLTKGRNLNTAAPGLISAKGRTIDEAGEALWQAGYFGAGAARPSEADVLELIEQAIARKTYKPEEAATKALEREEDRSGEEFQSEEEAEAGVRAYADELGIQLNPDELRAATNAIGAGMSVEDAVTGVLEAEGSAVLAEGSDETGNPEYDIPFFEDADEQPITQGATADEDQQVGEAVEGPEGLDGDAGGRAAGSVEPQEAAPLDLEGGTADDALPFEPKPGLPELGVFKSGDFYVIYGGDAKIAAQVLGITLTRDKAGRQTTAIPAHAVAAWKADLEAAGYTLEYRGVDEVAQKVGTRDAEYAELAAKIVDAVNRGGSFVIPSNEGALHVNRPGIVEVRGGRLVIASRKRDNQVPPWSYEAMLEQAERTARPANTSQDNRNANPETVEGGAALPAPQEPTYRDGQEAARAIEAGELTDKPERVGYCYKFAGEAAIAGKGDLHLIAVQAMNGQWLWHGVVVRPDGLIYDPQFDAWFAPNVYRGTVALQWHTAKVMTGAEVAAFGEANKKWPSPSLVGIEGTAEEYFRSIQTNPTPRRPRQEPVGDVDAGSLALDADQAPRTGMTPEQRAELEARQQQSKARRGGQQGLGDQAGGLFDSARDQSDLFGTASPAAAPGDMFGTEGGGSDVTEDEAASAPSSSAPRLTDDADAALLAGLPDGARFVEGRGVLGRGRWAVEGADGKTLGNYEDSKAAAVASARQWLEVMNRRNAELDAREAKDAEIAARLLAGEAATDADLKHLGLKATAGFEWLSPVVQRLFGISKMRVREAMGAALRLTHTDMGAEKWVGDAKAALANAAAYAKPTPAPELPAADLLGETEAEAEARLKDAGEKIGGARKDRWAERGMNLADLEGMREGEAFQLVTKDQVWPKPDFAKLVEGGMLPEVAALYKIVRDRFAAKPKKDSADERRAYVKMLGLVRDQVRGYRSVDDFKELQRTVLDAAGWDLSQPSYARRSPEVNQLVFSIAKGRSLDLAVTGTDQRKAQKLVAEGFPGKAEPWTRRYEVRQSWARNEADRVWYVMRRKDKRTIANNLPSKEEAEAQARALYEADQANGGGEKVMPDRPHLDNIQRTGEDVRGGRDVDSTDFITAFGFRGVEFGNWVASDERQKSVNLAFDALHDLARVLGIPPRALSLGGELGLAFGARGSGRAAAHYEPGKLVINLTKTSGAGTLAHEWGHALDHYFGELDREKGTAGAARGASGWYKRTDSRVKELANLRPEMAAAWDRVMQVIFKRDLSRAEAVRNLELEAESLEGRLQRARAAKERAEAMPVKGPRSQRDKDTARAQADGAISFLERRRGELAAELVDLRDPAKPYTPKSGRTSQFFTEAKKLSGKAGEDGYWSRPTELLARSFESYVFDRIKDAGAVSEYLVQGVEPERYASDNYKGNPYPVGEERDAINAAYDALFAAMQVRDGARAPELYSLGGRSGERSTFGTVDVDKTDTVMFKAWFGDSKVVDEAGKPLVVYHATASEEDFTEFESGRQGFASYLGIPVATQRYGMFFAERREFAEEFGNDASGRAKTNARIMPVYLSIQRPFDMRDDAISKLLGTPEGDAFEAQTGFSLSGLYARVQEERWEEFDGEWGADFVARLQEAGYDGARMFEADNDGVLRDVWIAFEPTQIKSAVGNVGTFDGTNPDIRFALERGPGNRVKVSAKAWDAERQRLEARLRALGVPESVKLRLTAAVRSIRTGEVIEGAEGMSSPGLVQILAGATDPDFTLDHEAIHALKELVFFPAAEWRALEKAAAADTARMAEIRERYAEYAAMQARQNPAFDAEAFYLEEAIADMFGDFRAGRLEPQGFVRRGLRRIRELIEAVGNWLSKDVGVAITARGVLKDVAAGRFNAPAEVGRNRLRELVDRLMVAWHGTPHDFDEFKTSAIGTGEGAQAFGWGLYFASKKAIAEYYRDTLSRRKSGSAVMVGGMRITPDDNPLNDPAKNEALRELASADGDFDAAIAELNGRLRVALHNWREYDDRGARYLADKYAAARDRLASWKANGARYEKARGKLFKVELAPTDDEYLDWDTPIEKQSAIVQAAVAKIKAALEANGGYDDIFERFNGDIEEASGAELVRTWFRIMGYNDSFPVDVPADVERALEEGNWDKAGSLYLKSLGVRGIRYLDAASRGRGPNLQKQRELVELEGRRDMLRGQLEQAAAANWAGTLPAWRANRERDLAEVERNIERVREELDPAKTRNYVIFDEADVRVVERASLKRDAAAAVAQRFGLTPAEVQSIVDTPLAELKRRDAFVPPNNGTEPLTGFERFPIGTAKVGINTDPRQAYVEVLRSFDPTTLDPTERDAPPADSLERYTQWARQGLTPPPVSVFPGRAGRFNTSSRRRTLAARAAGSRELLGWFSPDNPETGVPLKYGDVLDAYAAASQPIERASLRGRGAAMSRSRLSDPTPPGVWEALRASTVPLMARLRQATSLDSLGETLDRLRTAMQDQFLPLYRTQEIIERQSGARLPEGSNPYQAQELMAGRIGSRIDELMDEHITPLFRAMYEAKVTQAELETFLYARHAPERNAHIQSINPAFLEGGSGMTDAEAAAVMQAVDASGKRPALEALAARYDALNRAVMDIRVADGLLSQDQADAWAAQFAFYAPLRGRADLDPDTGLPRPSFGGGINVRGRESERAFGRKSAAVDILAYTVLQAQEAIIRGENNRVGQAFHALAKANPDPGFWKVDKITMRPVWDKAAGQVRFQPTRRLLAEDKDWTVSVKIDGVEHRVTMNRNNPAARRLAAAMRNLNGQQFGALVQTFGAVNRYLSHVNTTLNPEFIITNAFRDLQTALVNLGQYDVEGIRRGVVRDYRRALVGAFKGIFRPGSTDPWAVAYREFTEDGGRVYFNNIEDLGDVRRKIARELANVKPGPSARKAVSRLFKTVEDFNQAVESAVRLAAYKNARDGGMSRPDAARLAKNLTINFNKRGTYGPIMNSMYLFYNASVQGTAVLFGAMKHRRVQKVLAGVVAAGFIVDMLNSMLSGDDEDDEPLYDKVSEFDKQRNLILMVPGDDGFPLKMPLPYGYNVFYTIGRNAAELARGRAPLEVFGDFATTFVDAFNPVGGTNSLLNFLAPTIFDPAVDLGRNRDFAERPIMPDQPPYEPPVPDNQRYWNSVSPYWKAVTDELGDITGGDGVKPGAIDISPETLEYLGGYAGGAMFAFYERLATTPLKFADPSAEITANDFPFVRKVIGGTSPSVDRNTFYERADELEQLRVQAKQYRERGEFAKAAALERDNRPKLNLRGRAEATRERLSNIRRRRDQAYDDREAGKLTRAEWSKKIAALREEERAAIVGFNRLWNNRTDADK